MEMPNSPGILHGMPNSLGNFAWGCQILQGIAAKKWTCLQSLGGLSQLLICLPFSLEVTNNPLLITVIGSTIASYQYKGLQVHAPQIKLVCHKLACMYIQCITFPIKICQVFTTTSHNRGYLAIVQHNTITSLQYTVQYNSRWLLGGVQVQTAIHQFACIVAHRTPYTNKK